MKIYLILLASISISLNGCSTAQQIWSPSSYEAKQQAILYANRPSSEAALCMEKAIVLTRKARTKYGEALIDNGRASCESARYMQDVADKHTFGFTKKYEHPCPERYLANAYESYKSRVFALENIPLKSCPINFQNMHQKYTAVLRDLRDFSSTNKNIPFQYFENISKSGVAGNPFEQKYLDIAAGLYSPYGQLHHIYYTETGWCFNSNNRDDTSIYPNCISSINK